MEDQEYLDTSEIAEQIGIPTAYVHTDIRNGILPAKKMGSSWVIRPEDASKYVHFKKTILQSISMRELERRTGQDRGRIRDAIHKGDLPVTMYPTHKARHTWYILEKDAKEYCQRMEWEYTDGKQSQIGNPSPLPPAKQEGEEEIEMLITHTCAACGTARGNIMGDVDKNTGQRYGSLCMKCYLIVRDFGGDPDRIRKVSDYLARTR